MDHNLSRAAQSRHLDRSRRVDVDRRRRLAHQARDEAFQRRIRSLEISAADAGAQVIRLSFSEDMSGYSRLAGIVGSFDPERIKRPFTGFSSPGAYQFD